LPIRMYKFRRSRYSIQRENRWIHHHQR